jgi:hypothetical protein
MVPLRGTELHCDGEVSVLQNWLASQSTLPEQFVKVEPNAATQIFCPDELTTVTTRSDPEHANGAGVGVAVGVGEAVGEPVGEPVGPGVGEAVGPGVGEAVGAGVGEAVVPGVGEAVVPGVGETVGASVGETVGGAAGGEVLRRVDSPGQPATAAMRIANATIFTPREAFARSLAIAILFSNCKRLLVEAISFSNASAVFYSTGSPAEDGRRRCGGCSPGAFLTTEEGQAARVADRLGKIRVVPRRVRPEGCE